MLFLAVTARRYAAKRWKLISHREFVNALADCIEQEQAASGGIEPPGGDTQGFQSVPYGFRLHLQQFATLAQNLVRAG